MDKSAKIPWNVSLILDVSVRGRLKTVAKRHKLRPARLLALLSEHFVASPQFEDVCAQLAAEHPPDIRDIAERKNNSPELVAIRRMHQQKELVAPRRSPQFRTKQENEIRKPNRLRDLATLQEMIEFPGTYLDDE
jgi:hypothetical protein